MASEKAVEAAARKITEMKGVDPDTLAQIHVFTGNEPFDFEDNQGRRFLKLWKVHNKAYAEAALDAAAAVDGDAVWNEAIEAAAKHLSKLADDIAADVGECPRSANIRDGASKIRTLKRG